MECGQHVVLSPEGNFEAKGEYVRQFRSGSVFLVAPILGMLLLVASFGMRRPMDAMYNEPRHILAWRLFSTGMAVQWATLLVGVAAALRKRVRYGIAFFVGLGIAGALTASFTVYYIYWAVGG